MNAEQEEKMVQQLCLKLHDLQNDAVKATTIPKKWTNGRTVKDSERLPPHLQNASLPAHAAFSQQAPAPIAIDVEDGE